jgi:molybdopterin molybdotransferase
VPVRGGQIESHRIDMMLALDEALDALLAKARPVVQIETVATLEAGGRVLAQAVISPLSVPPEDNSEIDGYAVRCADLSEIPTSLPVSQKIAAGMAPSALQPGTAARIFTGAPIPAGCDAIVPQEAAHPQGDRVAFAETPAPGQWIRRRGLDIVAGARLRAAELGLAASIGIASLPVRRRVRVGVLFTGDELIMPGQPLAPGRIYNSNRFVLRALLQALGCEVTDLGIVPDQADLTRQAIVDAATTTDLVISCGGVSVGEADHVKAAVRAEGAIDLWQIAMKPGKPLASGHIRGVPFVGLPGNPVSSLVTFLLLARPFILKLQGVANCLPRPIPMRADFEVRRAGSRREFLRVRVGAEGALELFPVQNSAALTSAAWAHGLADVAIGATVAPGDIVPYLPFSELLN